MYMTLRSWMSFIMELIGPELSRVICPRMRKFALFEFVYILAYANIDQLVPDLATIYMPIRSQMSLIKGQIEPEHQSYLPLNFEKKCQI